jgi:hypothetical protein
MQVSGGLLCLVEQLALGVHHFVVHGDNGVLGDFHENGRVKSHCSKIG